MLGAGSMICMREYFSRFMRSRAISSFEMPVFLAIPTSDAAG